jgi:regulatory protein
MLGSRAPKKLNAEGLWAYSLKLLGGRAQSAGEVRQKLHRRAENEADVELTMAKLREYGYLNDTRFAESYATWRKENEGFGRTRVLRDLRQRRIAPALAETAVHQVFEGTDEEEQVEAFLKRKYRNVVLGELLQDQKKLQSAYRRLRYAGFGSSVVVKVLKRYASHAERLEDEPDEAEEVP